MTNRYRPGFGQMTDLSLGMLIALTAVLFLGLRSVAAQTSPLAVTVEPAMPIQIGETGAFTVTLENPTGTARTLVLSVTLSGPIENRNVWPVSEASQGGTRRISNPDVSNAECGMRNALRIPHSALLKGGGQGHRYSGSFTLATVTGQPVELIVVCNEADESSRPLRSAFTSQGRADQIRRRD